MHIFIFKITTEAFLTQHKSTHSTSTPRVQTVMSGIEVTHMSECLRSWCFRWIDVLTALWLKHGYIPETGSCGLPCAADPRLCSRRYALQKYI